jgi:serine phosphatase RsbU (regulator of sigma subunit)
VIEAENEQRARELEEARQLKLSMPPKSIDAAKSMPQLPHVEIAALMKTATEVGGDCYGWSLGADEALTIAIGDATGHGLKAGTLVRVRKACSITWPNKPTSSPRSARPRAH